MDVFVKEPLLDWKQYAAREAKALGTRTTSAGEGSESGSSLESTDVGELSWYPAQKVRSGVEGCERGWMER